MAKTVVVTGASSGIGEATVRLLTQRGWTVYAVARRQQRLEELAAQTGAIPVVVDITSQADVDRFVEVLRESGAQVNALVNNAGGAIGTDLVEDAPLDAWETMYRVNVIGTVRVTKALLPLLRQSAGQEPSSDILTVSSTAGHIAYEGGGGYTAAKHGTTTIVETLRLELAGEPIRVTEIAPGMVRTDEFTLNRLAGDRTAADALYEGVAQPLVAEDVALVIANTLELPSHINLDLVVMRPVAQAAQHKLVRGPLRPKP